MIIDCIIDHIGRCPLLSDYPEEDRHVGFTVPDRPNFGIFPDSDSETGICYINGNAERAYSFDIVFRTPADSDSARISESGFIEKLCSCLSSDPPILPDGYLLTSFSVSGEMITEFAETGGSGVLRLKCRLTYFMS